MSKFDEVARRLDLLVVEDNQGDVRLIRTYLSESSLEDWQIEHAERLEEALVYLEAFRPDVLLVDVFLEDAGGKETFRRLSEASGDVPIIVMSGVDRPDIQRAALRQGVAEFLPKDWLDEEMLERRLRLVIERHQVQRELDQQKKMLERYRAVVENATDAITLKDMEGRYLLVNDKLETLFGRPREEILGATAAELLGEESAETIREGDRLVLRHGEPFIAEEQVALPTEKGERTFLTSKFPFEVDGETAGTVGIARDITELKQLEQQARYDHLTGLPSREPFGEQIEQALRWLKRAGENFAVGLVDIDAFSRINDSLGHEAGDRVLQFVAERLDSLLEATVARLDGDEFGLLVESLQARADLRPTAERIREVFTDPFTVEETEIHLTASIGFAYRPLSVTFPGEIAGEVDRLIQTAERAVSGAQKSPETAWRTLDLPQERQGADTVNVENEIRRGLEIGEFEPHFQPIYNVRDGGLRALEILARWRHPNLGLVSPGVFLPVARRSGLLRSMTEQLLARACHQVDQADLPEAWPSPLAVNLNLSPSEIARPDVAVWLAESLRVCNSRRLDLQLEVTERQLVERLDVLGELREAGFRILVDDFGTGYSSLSRLKEMPMDELKLDMEFVHGAVDNHGDRAILETVTELGGQLGLPVVGEGVETERQLEVLCEAGCTAVQGYLLGRPARLENLVEGWTVPDVF